MSNVVSMELSCDYLVERAAKHRLAGRYDEAMALLTKARGQFGSQDAVEYALAEVYEAMDCEEEATRAYLRVVRMRGPHQAKALFQLALLAAGNSDTLRALSYFKRFAETGKDGVPQEAAMALYDELRISQSDLGVYSRANRANYLQRRAVDRLREGKPYAARRTLEHAMALHEDAQGHTLLACCALMCSEADEAVRQAQRAHAADPSSVQALCVLSDALYLAGREKEGRRAVMLAALRAKEPEELMPAAIQSAKHQEDEITLRLTGALLRRRPFHTHGMQLRACALANLGRMREASRLFGRLCGLKPEDTVCEYYYRATREGQPLAQRLSLGLDVPHEEAVARAKRIVNALASAQEGADPETQRALCRLCAWALRSPQAGDPVIVAALMLLGAMDTPAARETLMDAMTDPRLPDSLKRGALQTLSAVNGVKPYDVDFGGQLLLVAAGGTANAQVGENGSEPVQLACDALMESFPDAAGRLLPMWIAYLNAYGPAKGKRVQACAAALEYAYHEDSGRHVSLSRIAGRYGVSGRLSRLCLRRIRGAAAKREKTTE